VLCPAVHRLHHEAANHRGGDPAATKVRHRQHVVHVSHAVENVHRADPGQVVADDRSEPRPSRRRQHPAVPVEHLTADLGIGQAELEESPVEVGPEGGAGGDELDCMPVPSPGWRAIESHHRVPRERVAAGLEMAQQVRAPVGLEHDHVEVAGPTGPNGRKEDLLDVTEGQIELRGIHPGVVQVVDGREPGVGDDGSPPCGLNALEQRVQGDEESSDGRERPHGGRA